MTGIGNGRSQAGNRRGRGGEWSPARLPAKQIWRLSPCQATARAALPRPQRCQARPQHSRPSARSAHLRATDPPGRTEAPTGGRSAKQEHRHRWPGGVRHDLAQQPDRVERMGGQRDDRKLLGDRLGLYAATPRRRRAHEHQPSWFLGGARRRRYPSEASLVTPVAVVQVAPCAATADQTSRRSISNDAVSARPRQLKSVICHSNCRPQPIWRLPKLNGTCRSVSSSCWNRLPSNHFVFTRARMNGRGNGRASEIKLRDVLESGAEG